MVKFSLNKNLKERILRHDRSVPRYTSYPAAPCFQTDDDPILRYSWLETLSDDKPISLYVHVPFCPQLCYYCGCHTFATTRADLIRSYCDTLIKEIDFCADFMPSALSVSHVHFGGGSPTALPPILLIDILNKLRLRFNFTPSCEIALEADPRQLPRDAIALYCENGINRISLGVQETDLNILAAVNRPQSFALTQEAVLHFRQQGVKAINIDLMYGLPGQRSNHIHKTMQLVTELRPERIAFFGYAHVPWMKKNMNAIGNLALPDASDRFDMQEEGRWLLQEAGYIPVGIDHFALPDSALAQAALHKTLQRNFQGYTTDTCETLIGFGASAISMFKQGYAQNTPDLRRYNDMINNGSVAAHKILKTGESDKITRQVINEIMSFMCVSLSEVIDTFQLQNDYFNSDLDRLQTLCADGLVRIDDNLNIIVLHPQIARLAAYAFDRTSQLQSAPARHSKAI